MMVPSEYGAMKSKLIVVGDQEAGEGELDGAK